MMSPDLWRDAIMLKFTHSIAFTFLVLLATATHAADYGSQNSPGSTPASPSTLSTAPSLGNIDGMWITQAGSVVEISTTPTEGVYLTFPDFARRMDATFDGSTLVYITHYRHPEEEECYIDVPASDFEACKKFIEVGDPRHKFTLRLSANGMVLSGTKEKSVLQCEWDTDASGKKSNIRSKGYVWKYDSDYQWVRINCDFSRLPSLNGNAIERYNLISQAFAEYGLNDEFSLKDFVIQDRIKFVYQQDYLDSDTGVYVPYTEISKHSHIEPLDGRVVLDEKTGKYDIELFPYSFDSYVNLLSGLTILLNELHALETQSGETKLSKPSIQMQLDGLGYVWTHRNRLCAGDDETFGHHIDFLQRALTLLQMAQERTGNKQ
jgi:hypothetical protein